MCRVVEESREPCSLVAVTMLTVVLLGVAVKEQTSLILAESFPSPSCLSLNTYQYLRGLLNSDKKENSKKAVK